MQPSRTTMDLTCNGENSHTRVKKGWLGGREATGWASLKMFSHGRPGCAASSTIIWEDELTKEKWGLITSLFTFSFRIEWARGKIKFLGLHNYTYISCRRAILWACMIGRVFIMIKHFVYQLPINLPVSPPNFPCWCIPQVFFMIPNRSSACPLNWIRSICTRLVAQVGDK